MGQISAARLLVVFLFAMMGAFVGVYLWRAPGGLIGFTAFGVLANTVFVRLSRQRRIDV